MNLNNLCLSLALSLTCLPCAIHAQDKARGTFEGNHDIGEVQNAGSLEFDDTSKTYTVSGGGENMWAKEDALHFVWKKMSGDLSIAADIKFVGTDGNEHRKACLLFRQDLDPDSAYVDAAYHGDGLTSIQYRELKGGETREVQSNISHPYRIRLEKVGDLISMSIASEGEELRPSGGSFRIKLADPFYVGIGVCSHDNTVIEKAVFSNLKIEAGKNEGLTALASTLETVEIASADRRVIHHSLKPLSSASWGADGKTLLFQIDGDAYSIAIDGSAPIPAESPATTAATVELPIKDGDGYENRFPTASPDGESIAFLSLAKDSGDAMLRVVPTKGGDVRTLAKFNGGDPAAATAPAWSLDGRLIAFVSHSLVVSKTALLPESQMVPITPGEAKKIVLWENGAPGFEHRKDEPERAESYWVKNIHQPSITAYLPPEDKATGTAIVICPGGGHRELVFKAEGVEAAEYLNKLGVAAFVLKYRLAREPGAPYSVREHPRQDALRAMRLIRNHASHWGIDPSRIGMMGFSAGGEVVSMVAYDSGEGEASSADPIERFNAKPDFQILIYPGPLGIPEVIPNDAPPAFLLVANDDRGASRVISGLFQGYRRARRPVEAHIFSHGGHGFNMGNRSQLKTLRKWPERLGDWLSDNDYLKVKGGADSR